MGPETKKGQGWKYPVGSCVSWRKKHLNFLRRTVFWPCGPPGKRDSLAYLRCWGVLSLWAFLTDRWKARGKRSPTTQTFPVTTVPEEAFMPSPVLPSHSPVYSPPGNSKTSHPALAPRTLSLRLSHLSATLSLGTSREQIGAAFPLNLSGCWWQRPRSHRASLLQDHHPQFLPRCNQSGQAKLCYSNKQSQHLRGSQEQMFIPCSKEKIIPDTC